jgi:hypothetical protein
MRRIFCILAMAGILFGSPAAGVAVERPPLPFEPFEVGPEYTAGRLHELGFSGADDPSLPNDPFFAKQYHLLNVGQPDDKDIPGLPGADIGMIKAWQQEKPAHEIVVAILDSGLDLTHEDIDPAILWVNPGETGLDAEGRDKATNGVDDDGNGFIDDVHGWNFVRNTNSIQEDQYHGTPLRSDHRFPRHNGIGIAGMAGGMGIRLMVVKIFGLGGTLYSKDIARAVKYAVDNGARVLSNSYGTPSFTQEMKDAIAYTESIGALFVCASGNSRKNLDDPEAQDYPSCYGIANQLVVGAVDNNDRSTFCNFGSMVEIAAPGQHIFSLFPKNTYRSLSGTSQACPMVAAAAGMVWARNPTWTWREVKQALLKGADQVVGLGRYVVDGLRMNVDHALAGRTGRRFPKEVWGKWVTEPRVVETSHPYYNDKVATFSVQVHGATRMRLRFTRIAIDHHGDSLTIRDREGQTIEFINGQFPQAHWSEVIPGDTANLEFISGPYVNDWGFKIEAVQYLPESPTGASDIP